MMGLTFSTVTLSKRMSAEDILYSVYLNIDVRYLPGSIISVVSLGAKKLFLLL
jgi:hypothetical protein